MAKFLGKIFCFFGGHSWEAVVNNLVNRSGRVVVYRAYNRCKHCKKWGKLILFRDL